MIEVYKQKDRIIGKFKCFISYSELLSKHDITDIKNIVHEKLLQELDKEVNAGLFTYKLINTEYDEDMFGYIFTVEFEFIPNKELVEELKLVSERLTIGL